MVSDSFFSTRLFYVCSTSCIIPIKGFSMCLSWLVAASGLLMYGFCDGSHSCIGLKTIMGLSLLMASAIYPVFGSLVCFVKLLFTPELIRHWIWSILLVTAEFGALWLLSLVELSHDGFYLKGLSMLLLAAKDGFLCDLMRFSPDIPIIFACEYLGWLKLAVVLSLVVFKRVTPPPMKKLFETFICYAYLSGLEMGGGVNERLLKVYDAFIVLNYILF